MPRVPSLIVLYASPLVLTLALVLVAFGIHAIGRGFGSTRSPGALILGAALVWLLHAGYLAGPWLFNHQRQLTAICLMIPIAIAGILFTLAVARQLLPSGGETFNPKLALVCLGSIAAVLVSYAAPITVMVISKAHAESPAD